MKKRILYLHQYFKTPQDGGAIRSYLFAKYLVSMGYEVNMVTTDQVNDFSGWKFEDVEGINVYKCSVVYNNNMAFLARLKAFLKYMIMARRKAVDIGGDIVFATSTPLTIAIPAIYAKKKLKIPFIFEVRDLWPDVPYEMGYIKNIMLFKLLKSFEYRVYKKADAIITISQGIKNKIAQDFHEKTFVVPFGVARPQFANKNYRWKNEKGIKGETLYVFTGTIGIANSVEYLIEAAKLLKLKSENQIHIALVSNGGSAEKQIKELALEYELENVSFHNGVSRNRLFEIYQSADAGIILFGKSETYRYTASPNKFFDYVGAGLPFFFNFEGPLKESVEHDGIGVFSDFTLPQQLAENMIYYHKNKDKLIIMGEKGFNLAQVKYNQEKIFSEMDQNIFKKLMEIE